MFESVSSYEGIYMFLAAIVGNTQDKDIYHKYIEAAAKCNQIKVLESIITEKKECYDPEYVKNFLKEQRLPDPRPLIFLCDINGYVDELTRYLYKNNFNKYIEIYIFRVNNQATPQVLGTLIDMECDETYIK
jgi:clathrin heavy chain